MTDVLDPSAILSRIHGLLPPSASALKAPQDAIVALFHAALSALSFRLIGVDDSTATQTYENNVLPTTWNEHGPGHYALRYRHEQSSLEFLIKVSKLGPRTMVNAIALESDKAASLDIATADFTSPSFFPQDLSASDAPPLVHGLIGTNRVSDLLTLFKLNIIQKLVPGLRKEGYTEVDSDSNTHPSTGPRPGPGPGTTSGIPARPAPPPEQPYDSRLPPRNPLEIGRSDRDPFPGINPFAPPSLFPQSGGDGMFVGPDHPIFSGQGGIRGGPPGGGPWGGDGYLPPMGAPPGARFDPIGPFAGRGRGGPPRGPLRGGDPDNDEFMPPGIPQLPPGGPGGPPGGMFM